MPWRHVDDEPFTLPTRHSLERLGHSLVVCTGYERWPHPLNEFDELFLTKFPIFELLQADQLRLDGTQVTLGQLSRRNQGLNILQSGLTHWVFLPLGRSRVRFLLF